MTNKTPTLKKKRSVLARIGRVISIFIVSLILLLIILVLLIQTGPVQNLAKGKVEKYLGKKLKTNVQIGWLRVDFPNTLVLKNLYIEDQTKDTLLSGGEMKVDLDMIRLFKNEIQIEEITLTNVTAKVKRILPDTAFNFQFIVDAFVREDKKDSPTQDTTTLKMDVQSLVLDKIRIVYKDVLTGNDLDMYLGHLDTKINKFDPVHFLFEFPRLNIDGLTGYFYQNEPLQAKLDSAVAKAIAAPGPALQLVNKEIFIKNVDFVYRSVPAKLTTAFRIKNLEAHPKKMDMYNGVYEFSNFILENSDIAVQMASERNPVKPLSEPIPFILRSDEVKITESNFKLDDASMPVLTHGIDYGHMGIEDITLTASAFTYRIDTILASIKTARLREKTGFVLDELNANFMFTDKQTVLQDFYIKTPGSVIRRNAIVSYPSVARIKDNVGALGLDLDIVSSVVKVKDLLSFAPLLRLQPAFSNPNETIMLNGRVRGRLDALRLDNVQFRGLKNTNVFVSGILTGLPDPKRFAADLNIRNLTTTRNDITALIPKGMLPPNVSIPQSVSASGRIKGNMNGMLTDLRINSSDGNVKLKGSITNLADPRKVKYNMAVATAGLNLATILKNPQMPGPLSATFTAKGTGFDPATANANFSGMINSVVFRNYAYRNVPIEASIRNKQFSAKASIHDPNIDMVLEASGVMDGEYPSLNIFAEVDSIKTQPLRLTPDIIVFRGQVRANFPSTNPDKLVGNFMLTNSVVVANGQRVILDTVNLVAANTDSGQMIRIESDFITARITGNYRLTQLADVFMQSINPYFSVAKYATQKIDPYSFSITANIIDHPGLRALIPGLTQFEPVVISANFSSTQGMNGIVDAPLIVMNGNRIEQLKMNAITVNNTIELNTSVTKLKTAGLNIYATTVAAKIANNNINFDLNIKDRLSNNRYTITGLLTQPVNQQYSLSILPSNLMLNYQPWSINNGNRIDIRDGGVIANQFVLNHGSEQLSINSTQPVINSPLSIDFNNFKISTITGFIQSDSILVNGNINGNVLIKNIQTQPSFTSGLTINDLSFNKDTLGDVKANVSNISPNIFATDITLTGRGNDLSIKGTYYLKPANQSSVDIDININALQLHTIEGLTMNSITEATGALNGKIAIKGTATNPDIDGNLGFSNTSFNISMLNTRFKIDDERITVDNSGIGFDSFTIRDTLNSTAVLNGKAYTTDFLNYQFDLNLTSDNFKALSSTKKQNSLYYGDLFITTDLSILGTNEEPQVDGSIKVNKGTKLSVVLPQAEPGLIEREGVVQFVDYSAMGNDSIFLLAYDSLNTSPLIGFDISTNIEIDKEAEFNLILDEGNGDFLNVKGEANLTAGIDPSGKITMTGSYELVQGSYELSFNFLRRKFDIEKGSRIVWRGEPTNAELDVRAIYEVNIAPLDLVSNQLEGAEGAALNIYRQKLPFQVILNLRGDLMKPEITFDIQLKEGNYGVAKDIVANVETKLAQIKNEPAELNKQAFAILLLNRFVSENPFDNSGGGLDAATFARQSASKLLTEQLNRLAAGLLEDVDINFDLASSEDFTTGERRQRTDFNVALSKQLLNDRLKVTVGSNFELEGPRKSNSQGSNFAGNLALDYSLTQDSRYLLRFYRKNEYQGILEGYVVETGINFIMTLDYNRFREIFKSIIKGREERKRKKAAKKDAKAEPKIETNEQLIQPQAKDSVNGN